MRAPRTDHPFSDQAPVRLSATEGPFAPGCGVASWAAPVLCATNFVRYNASIP
jgi:hypothetical protein